MPPDDDVVKHGGVGCIEEMRVLRPAGRDFGQIVGECRLQSIKCSIAFDSDGAQMRHVEHRGTAAASEVFSDGARRVGDWHLPATELDEVGVECSVLFGER